MAQNKHDEFLAISSRKFRDIFVISSKAVFGTLAPLHSLEENQLHQAGLQSAKTEYTQNLCGPL